LTQYGTSVACNWPRGNYDRAIERQNVSTPIFSVPHKPAICCIFCEGHCGDYLPFEPLLDMKGVAGKTSKEVIYYQSNKASKQLELFQFSIK
jgi:hypothetical protein